MSFGAAGLFGAYRIGVQLSLGSNIAQQSGYINRDLMALQARMRELQATALQTRQALLLASTGPEKAALRDSMRLQQAQMAGQRAQLLLTQNQAVKERELFQQRRAQMDELASQRASVGAQVGGLVTAGAFGVGILSGAAILSGVEGAAKLQLAMQTVAEATGATTGQLAKLNAMVLQTSGITAQSADVIAQEMATAARAGLNSYARLSQAFPQIARFADVQQFAAKAAGRIVDPAEMVSVGVQFAHYFQAYSGNKLTNMLNDLNKLMFTQPEDIQRLLTQGRYFIPMATRLGMSEPAIMQILAAMGQTGFLRGKGGTGLANTLLGAINAATVTEHLQGARSRALVELGLMNKEGKTAYIGPNGEFDSQLLWSGLIAAGARLQPTKFIADVQNAFGKQATQLISVLTGPQVQKQIKFIGEAFARMGTVEQMFNDFFNNLLPQWQRFTTNLNTLFITIFNTQVPTLTQAFKGLADALGNLQKFFTDHPKAAMAAAIGTMGMLGGAIAVLSAQAILWLNRLSIEIGILGNMAKAAAVSGAAGGAAGAEGTAGGLAAGGVLGVALRWGGSAIARIGTFMAPLLNIGRAIGRFLGDVLPGLARFAGWIASLGVLIYEFFKHPFQLGEFLGKITGWFMFKFFPGVQTALQNGWIAVKATVSSLWTEMISGFVGLIQKLAWVIAHPWDAARVAEHLAGQALTNAGAWIRSNYERTQQGYIKGMGQEAHQDILGGRASQHHIHIHGGVHINANHHDPKKLAMQVLDEMGKQSRSALRSRGSTPNVPGFSYHEAMAT